MRQCGAFGSRRLFEALLGDRAEVQWDGLTHSAAELNDLTSRGFSRRCANGRKVSSDDITVEYAFLYGWFQPVAKT